MKYDKKLLSEHQLKHLRGSSIKSKPTKYVDTREQDSTQIVDLAPKPKTKPNAKTTIIHKTHGHSYVVSVTPKQAEAYKAVAINKNGLNYDILRKYFLASTIRKLLDLNLFKVDKTTLNVTINTEPYSIKEKPGKIVIMMPF